MGEAADRGALRRDDDLQRGDRVRVRVRVRVNPTPYPYPLA